MDLLKKNIYHFPLGIWIALIALFLIFIAWLMQGYSLIDWQGAIKLGVQNESFAGNAVEQALADVERGVAIADIIWVLPLTLIAFIGILKKKFIGLIAAMMVYAICVYFPLFYVFRNNTESAIRIAVIVLWAVPSILGIISLWTNRKYFDKE
jgi:uncharacterized membrane protein